VTYHNQVTKCHIDSLELHTHGPPHPILKGAGPLWPKIFQANYLYCNC